VSDLLSTVFLASLVSGGVIVAVPLVFAGLGEAISERAGILNVGLEGMMLSGAYGGFVASITFDSTWLGLLAGGIVGMIVSLLMVGLCIRLNANQIVIGIAITVGAEGVTALLHSANYADTYPRVPNAGSLEIPLLSKIPVLGEGLFSQHASTYIAILLVILASWVLRSTGLGLHIKAAGDNPRALEAAGGNPRTTRTLAVLTTGFLAGVGGAHIVLMGAGVFVPAVTHGAGFIAIVLAMLARGKFGWIIAGAILIGMSLSLTTALQLVGVNVPIDAVQMLPFVLILAVMAIFGRDSYLPAALALPYDREER
jgi:general nucleoside transport system permease protein